MFNTKEARVEGDFVSKFIDCGNQELTITGFSVRTAASGRKQVTFNMESPAVGGKFEAHEDAKFGGKIGWVTAGRWTDESNAEEVGKFVDRIATIATKLGVKNEADAIEASTLEEYMDKIVPLFIGKFAYFSLAGEEREKQDGKIVVNKSLRNLSYVSSKEEGIDHLDPWDRAKHWNYKSLAKPEADGDIVGNTSGGAEDKGSDFWENM